MRTAGFSSERALRGQRCAGEAATHQFLRASAMRSTPARSGDSVLHESAGPGKSSDALDALDLAGDELGVGRFLSDVSSHPESGRVEGARAARREDGGRARRRVQDAP